MSLQNLQTNCCKEANKLYCLLYENSAGWNCTAWYCYFWRLTRIMRRERSKDNKEASLIRLKIYVRGQPKERGKFENQNISIIFISRLFPLWICGKHSVSISVYFLRINKVSFSSLSYFFASWKEERDFQNDVQLATKLRHLQFSVNFQQDLFAGYQTKQTAKYSYF